MPTAHNVYIHGEHCSRLLQFSFHGRVPLSQLRRILLKFITSLIFAFVELLLIGGILCGDITFTVYFYAYILVYCFDYAQCRNVLPAALLPASHRRVFAYEDGISMPRHHARPQKRFL